MKLAAPVARIAWRNVVRNRRRSLITLFAVLLAVGVMVAVRGFLNGLQSTIREGVIWGQTGAIQVHRKGFLKSMQGAPLDLDLPADSAFLARIEKIPGVLAATPRIPFGGMANAHDQTVFALFQAFDPVREPKVCPRRSELLAGKTPFAGGEGTGDFTVELLKPLGAHPGDVIALLTNDREGVLNAIEIKTGNTIGEIGIPLPEKKFAWVPLPIAQQLLRMEGRATEIAVAARDLDHLEEVAAGIRAELGPDYEVSTWHDVAAFVDDLIKNQNAALGIVVYTFLLIALIGIANTMLLSVLERTREIGTMMSLGMRRRAIVRLFLAEAALLGFVGGLFGAMLGLGFVLHYGTVGIQLYLAGATAPTQIFPSIPYAYVARMFAIAVAGAALAALYPAVWASRLRPIEALTRV